MFVVVVACDEHATRDPYRTGSDAGGPASTGDYVGYVVALGGGPCHRDVLAAAQSGGAAQTGTTYVVAGPISGDVSLATGDGAGVEVARAGYVTGDGVPDVLAGAYRHSCAAFEGGAAYVLAGPARGGRRRGGLGRRLRDPRAPAVSARRAPGILAQVDCSSLEPAWRTHVHSSGGVREACGSHWGRSAQPWVLAMEQRRE